MFYGLSLARLCDRPNRLPVRVSYADFGLFRAGLRPPPGTALRHA